MARKTTAICDRCGHESTDETRWELCVRPIQVKCPPDGINGRHEADLCQLCRVKLDRIVSEFLKPVDTAAPAPGQEGGE